MSFPIEYPAPVLRETGKSHPYHYLPVPPEIGDQLLESGTRRVIADLNGFEVRRSLFSHGDGAYAIIVGLKYLKEAGVTRGDTLIVSIRPDPEPDRVDLCDEFHEALELDDEARERWESFTTGKQRSLAHHVNSAKRSSTRVRRALDVTEKIRTHTLHSDLND